MSERFTSQTTDPKNERTPLSIREQLKQGLYLMKLEGYTADNPWTLERASRDALQNFFDANNQSADNVPIDVTEGDDGSATVTIRGHVKYPFARLLSDGASHKDDRKRAAGGKGEGTRMIALTLLRDHGVQEVEYGSGEWRVRFYLDVPPMELNETDADQEQVRGLYARLEEVGPEEAVEGSYMKIHVPDRGTAEAFVKARDLFYHSHNTDFYQPDVETEKGGFRLLPEGQSGNFYLNGQRISFNEKEAWNTVPRFHLWSKERPEYKGEVLTLGRDREVVTEHEVTEIFLPFLVESMSREQLEQALIALEPFYELKTYHPGSHLGYEFLKVVIRRLASLDFQQVFDARDIAADVGNDDQEMLRALGCRPCVEELGKIGMMKASTFYKELQELAQVEPRPEQRERMRLVEDLARQFVAFTGRDALSAKQSMEALLATGRAEAFPVKRERGDVEVKPIALFHEQHPHVDGKYDDDVYWISENALRLSNPHRIMAIYLHEMCHKFGSDQSADFSYVLTTVLERWGQFLVEKQETFVAFARAWEKTPVKESWRTLTDAERRLGPMVRVLEHRPGHGEKEESLYKARQLEQTLLEMVEGVFGGQYTAETGKELFRSASLHPAMVAQRQFLARWPDAEAREIFEAERARQIEIIRGKEARVTDLRRRIQEEEKKTRVIGSNVAAKRTRQLATTAKAQLEAALKPLEIEERRLYAELRAYEQLVPDIRQFSSILEAVRHGSLHGKKIDLDEVGDLHHFGPRYARLLSEFLTEGSGGEKAEQELRTWLTFIATGLDHGAWRAVLLREAERLLKKMKQQVTPRELQYARVIHEVLIEDGGEVAPTKDREVAS